jgi:hypothetical protein
VFEKVKGALRSREEERLQRELDEAHATVKRLRKRLKKAEGDPFPADKLVWIFGTSRVGSTWLHLMIGELSGWERWNEPFIGRLFGGFYREAGGAPLNWARRDFVFSNPKLRRRAVRAFVLAALAEKFKGTPRVVIKEPNGSVGAPMLMEALPESRMILLIRDPRDVVASGLGAASEGGWWYEVRQRRGVEVAESPEEIVESRSKKYNSQIGAAKQAYEAHPGSKVLIRYEELRADTLGTMKRLCSALDIFVDERELAQAVERQAWENIPEDDKGPGKKRRKASPGGWREDLTPEQARRVEEITAPLLKEFYPPTLEV